jgi:hypothetical protein
MVYTYALGSGVRGVHGSTRPMAVENTSFTISQEPFMIPLFYGA